MDLVGVQPTFNLYNADWPILTWEFPPSTLLHFMVGDSDMKDGNSAWRMGL